MNCDIVIAHYKENIDWVLALDKSNISNIYIYTKDDRYQIHKSLEKDEKIIHQFLPNLGRESHTYLSHCLNYYNSLANFTIFLQGNPIEHGYHPNKINEWINNSYNFKYTNNFYIGCPYDGLDNKRRPQWYITKGILRPTELSKYDFDEWCTRYIGIVPPNYNARIYWTANFGVSKDRIFSRNMHEYKKLIEQEFNTINPESAHFIERSWFYFFNLQHVI